MGFLFLSHTERHTVKYSEREFLGHVLVLITNHEVDVWYKVVMSCIIIDKWWLNFCLLYHSFFFLKYSLVYAVLLFTLSLSFSHTHHNPHTQRQREREGEEEEGQTFFFSFNSFIHFYYYYYSHSLPSLSLSHRLLCRSDRRRPTQTS